MPTNKIVLRTVEQVMADYTPVYQPIYPLFLSGKTQTHEMEVGKVTNRRIQAVGDLRAKHITPKDTEIRQVSVQEGTKTFKKYFLANQFTRSEFQSAGELEEVVKQVLDEHQVHQDELFLLGEGTSDSTMLNNGLYWSGDPFYTLENSVAIDDDDRLYDFHSKVMTTAAKAKALGGRKVVIFYGTSILPLYNSLFPTSAKPFKASLQETLGGEFSTFELPAAATPNGANGWLVANLDQVKTHYTILPGLKAQGMNEEKMYFWANFLMGSMMLEVLAQDGIIRQPATLAAPD